MCEREFPADGIHWTNGFSGKRPSFIPVVSPKPHSPVAGWILNDAVVGVMLHWAMGRTSPHFDKPLQCEGCAHKFPMRWYGYLGLWLPGVGRWALAEITKFAAYQNRLLQSPAAKLRGKYLTLRRRGEARTGAVIAEITERSFVGPLPECFDIKSALMLLWTGADNDRLQQGG